MKYCVIKNTIKVIDGSNNPVEIMLQNALNAGFTEDEVEILTEDEYQAKKASEPVPPPEPTEIEILKEQNELLKARLALLEHTTSETSATQQDLLELLLDMEVI